MAPLDLYIYLISGRKQKTHPTKLLVYAGWGDLQPDSPQKNVISYSPKNGIPPKKTVSRNCFTSSDPHHDMSKKATLTSPSLCICQVGNNIPPKNISKKKLTICYI